MIDGNQIMICSAVLTIGDDHADSSATIRCQLPRGHAGQHQEVYSPGPNKTVEIRWDFDDRWDLISEKTSEMLQEDPAFWAEYGCVEPGWYFEDQHVQYHGPYCTKEQAFFEMLKAEKT